MSWARSRHLPTLSSIPALATSNRSPKLEVNLKNVGLSHASWLAKLCIVACFSPLVVTVIGPPPTRSFEVCRFGGCFQT